MERPQTNCKGCQGRDKITMSLAKEIDRLEAELKRQQTINQQAETTTKIKKVA